MLNVPNTTTVATATDTLCACAFITGSVAITAAAPQIELPAPINMVVCSSSLNTRLPSCTAKINVPNSITTSVNKPSQPTPATCAKVILNPNNTTPALSNILLA